LKKIMRPHSVGAMKKGRDKQGDRTNRRGPREGKKAGRGSGGKEIKEAVTQLKKGGRCIKWKIGPGTPFRTQEQNWGKPSDACNPAGTEEKIFIYKRGGIVLTDLI